MSKEKEESLNVYSLIKTEAVNAILSNSDLHFCRKVCRWYSSTFHTPLNQVFTLPWDEVLLHYYEWHYDQLSYNEVLRIAKDILPDIAKKEETETEEFIKRLLEQEQEKKKQSLNKEPSSEVPQKGTPTNPPQEIFKTFEDDDIN